LLGTQSVHRADGSDRDSLTSRIVGICVGQIQIVAENASGCKFFPVGFMVSDQLADLHSPLVMFVIALIQKPPAAGAGEEAELSVAGLAPDNPQQLIRVCTARPLCPCCLVGLTEDLERPPGYSVGSTSNLECF
jgi:hypothetical protein